jgi:hypothetical protein
MEFINLARNPMSKVSKQEFVSIRPEDLEGNFDYTVELKDTLPLPVYEIELVTENYIYYRSFPEREA